MIGSVLCMPLRVSQNCQTGDKRQQVRLWMHVTIQLIVKLVLYGQHALLNSRFPALGIGDRSLHK